jgi:hypothetical protein
VTGVSIDDDDDGAAELVLSSGTTVVETQNGFSITLQLTSEDAAVLEGLNTLALELMMAPGTALDLADNGNLLITNADDKEISYGSPTLITIDGYIDEDEWGQCALAVADSNDSQWTSANEIQALSMTWDSLYLYIAISGIVTSNSWLLYIDADPDGPNGQTNLAAIDAWERGAVFTKPGFRADFQYGCYQHQGQYDGNWFYRIESATHAADISGAVLKAHDSMHLNGAYGGSELAIPWEVLYDLGGLDRRIDLLGSRAGRRARRRRGAEQHLGDPSDRRQRAHRDDRRRRQRQAGPPRSHASRARLRRAGRRDRQPRHGRVLGARRQRFRGDRIELHRL